MNSGPQTPAEEPEQEIADRSPASQPGTPEESTVGTGTFFAIGCTLATLVLILLGILVILLLR